MRFPFQPAATPFDASLLSRPSLGNAGWRGKSETAGPRAIGTEKALETAALLRRRVGPWRSRSEIGPSQHHRERHEDDRHSEAEHHCIERHVDPPFMI